MLCKKVGDGPIKEKIVDGTIEIGWEQYMYGPYTFESSIGSFSLNDKTPVGLLSLGYNDGFNLSWSDNQVPSTKYSVTITPNPYGFLFIGITVPQILLLLGL